MRWGNRAWLREGGGGSGEHTQGRVTRLPQSADVAEDLPVHEDQRSKPTEVDNQQNDRAGQHYHSGVVVVLRHFLLVRSLQCRGYICIESECPTL